MRNLTVPSIAVAVRSEKTLTPAMVSAVWEIAAKLDEDRVSAEVSNSVWVEMPTSRLRGPGARADNVWLRECLERLTSVTITGEHKGNPWGAVVLAEWEITEGGSLARLLVPPAGIKVFRAPQTFAKIEATAVYRLAGHGRRLYALLADKKRQRRANWEYGLDELRALLNVDDRRSYQRWGNFRQWVLDPAIAAINDYGTVAVRMTPKKLGRSVVAVRFDWSWKDPREAAETAAENERHRAARRRGQESAAAPPLIPEDPRQARQRLEREWWRSLDEAERDEWRRRLGATYELEGPGGMVSVIERREDGFASEAYGQVFGAEARKRG